MVSLTTMNYILNRCHIDECDTMEPTVYDAKWTEFVIPVKNGQMESCKRYNATYHISMNRTLSNILEYNRNECPSDMFNRSDIIPCPMTDDMVFRDQMSTISKDVNKLYKTKHTHTYHTQQSYSLTKYLKFE